MAPPKKRALPKPLPVGFILTDTEKNKWKLGKIIGEGGFGLIYLASKHVDRPVAADTDYVIKVEYQENGPLFSELKFYQRAAKLESMQKWKRSRKLDFLGIPTYWGSGLAEYNNLRYRFMAMDRLGSDLQKICDSNGGRLKKSTVLQLGQGLVTVLEYIHENEYVHADIKAANLMLGYRDQEQVYLADYGLSYRYCPDGVHKEYKENPKKGHNGTIEYTSLDAHKGLAPSRRGDLQILGFCLLQWLCGSLPWDNVLKNPNLVQEAKARLMDNLPDSVQQLSVSGASTDEVATFLLYVKTLGYQDNPDYQYLKTVLASVVTGRLDFSKPQVTPGKSITKAQDPTTSVQDLTTKAQDPTTSVQDLTTKIQDLTTRQKEAGRARGPPKAKAAASAVTDEPKKEKMTSKPVLPQYIKGPPLTKPQSQQKEDGVLPAVSRSLRPRPELAISYKEYDSEDEDEDEEETARPTPIPARYVRSPPIGPRAEPKQKTKSKWTCRKTDILTVNSERQEDRLDQRRRKRIPINCDGEDPTDMEHRSRWDEGLPRQAAGHSDLCHDNRDSLSEWEGSALRGLEREAGLTERNERFSWFVCVGVFLFLGAVLGVCQSAF